MSKPTRLPDAALAPPGPAVGLAAILLAVAYPLLAHLAAAREDRALAALAAADMVLLLLVEPMAQRRAWAWAALAAAAAALWWLARTDHAMLLLLAPPVVFTGFLAWWFGRSLRSGRSALITRIVTALYRQADAPVSEALLRYTRRLTAAWAGLLALLTLINLALAMIAVPDGLLHRLGTPPPLAISSQQWSLFANLLNYGIVGGFFFGEYVYRKRVFAQRPYRNLPDFLRQMARLGPAFWRDLLR
ncbi:MAG TPA: ketosynthase [Pseudoxanthomonas sp.]|nr:ketosynthase [Pseudoxanthomonas sp.]